MTTDDLKALPLGYLTGADLMQFCPANVLLSFYNQNNGALQSGCNQAYAEVASKLLTKYDCSTEIKSVQGDAREPNLVGITAVLALRRILGSAASLSDEMKSHFTWADACINDIRNGQMNLALPQPSSAQTASGAHLVGERFSTLG